MSIIFTPSKEAVIDDVMFLTVSDDLTFINYLLAEEGSWIEHEGSRQELGDGVIMGWKSMGVGEKKVVRRAEAGQKAVKCQVLA